MSWNVFARVRKPAKTKRVARRPRLFLESLEERTVPSALPIIFTIDQAASTVTASGTATYAGTPYAITPQGTGSLTTDFTGQISTSWDPDSATLTINQSGTDVVAGNSGNWAPKADGFPGTESANFGGHINALGGFVRVDLAVRGGKLQVNTPSAASLTDSGDGQTFSFPPSAVNGGLTAGSLDYRFSGFLSDYGRYTLATDSHDNQAADSGTFQSLGSGAYHLTVPFVLTITGSNLFAYSVTLTGSLQADAKLATVNLNGGSADGNDFATSAVGGGGPVNIADANAFIAVAGDADIELSKVTIKLTNASDGDAEKLAVDLTGIDGLTAVYDAGSHTLTISATSTSAKKSVFEAALRQVTFENTLDTPTLGDRLIEVTVTDLVGNTSAASTSTVTVLAP